MKKVFLALFSVLTLCFATQALAQDEKIIIDDKNAEGQTTIVIENGEVFIDGKKVADAKNSGRVEIIKKRTDPFEGNEDIQIEEFKRMFPQGGGRAMLGVRTQSPEYGDGAQIIEVVGRSAASQGGLEENDIITHIDQEKVRNPQDLVGIISSYDPNDEVVVRIERDGKMIERDIVLGENENAVGGAPRGMDSNPFGRIFRDFGNIDIEGMIPNMGGPRLGITIEDAGNDQGVLVVDVEKGSKAEQSGLLANDVVVQYGAENILTTMDLKKAVQNSSNKKTNIIVNRNGRDISLEVDMARAKRRSRL